MTVYEAIPTLDEPFVEDVIQQVRTGRVKGVFGLSLQSAIYKTVRKEPVYVTKPGLDGNEHAYHAHGGPEKALMQYCTAHYASWRQELPQSEHLFTVGGFGENLVSSRANERNVCIGDVFAFGEEVIAQVTYPRAPCAKLNHRFEIKDMARRAQTQARTGWYYRILQEGQLQAGSTMRLLRRPNPDWTVAKVQHYLYIEKSNVKAMREIIALEGLGQEVHDIFQKRLEKDEVEDQEGRLQGGSDDMVMNKWQDFRLVARSMESRNVACLTFEAVQPVKDPIPVLPGSHVRIKLGGKLVRAYSVVAGDSNHFELGIALSDQSRGGSKYLHESVQVGDVLPVGKFTASFPLSKEADHHILVAGGIGITAFIASAQYLRKSEQSFELHYAIRTSADLSFYRYLDKMNNVNIYDKAAGRRLDLHSVLSRSKANTHVYCCGPQHLMDGVAAAASACDMDESCVHFEAFEIATSGQPFTAELAISKRELEVGSDQSLLDVLRLAGFDVDSSCEVGNCGTCRVTYCGGTVVHRGTGLVKEEQEREMLSCVGRGVHRIVLEL